MRIQSGQAMPTLPENMTLEQLRDSIMDDFERLRKAGILSLPKHNGNEEETDGKRQTES